MTEESMFWSDGIGDGGPYTEDQLRLLFDALAGAEDANRGVLVRQGNELDPSSTGNNNIRVAIGRAVVDGTLYENDAILDIVTVSPAIGTTGRRCVLQKDWAARTVRAAIITSADGVGAIPALTQNDGTLWEISIASFTITTGGVIGALTDTREVSGASQPTRLVLKLGDQTYSSDIVLRDDTDLFAHIGPNETWAFELFLICGGPTAGDIRFALTTPAGATLAWAGLGLDIGAAAVTDVVFESVQSVSGNATDFGLLGVGTTIAIRIVGTIANGATPGDLQLQHSQRVSNGSSLTVGVNSWMKLTRVE